MYCALAPIVAPEFASAVNPVHEPSGVGVFPVRTLITRAVPAGVSLVHVALAQVTTWPALKIRESKVHDVAYGLIRSQSVDTPAPLALKSLTMTRMVSV